MEGIKFREFVSQFDLSTTTGPILLVEQIAESNSEEVVFKTIPTSRDMYLLSTQGRKMGTKPLKNALIFQFQHLAKSMFTSISVGRATTNKICLPDNAVSKMHISFKRNEEDDWVLIDANSENGTRVNGSAIKPNQRFILSNGTGITLADTYHCTFFTPQGFNEYLESLGPGKNKFTLLRRTISLWLGATIAT